MIKNKTILEVKSGDLTFSLEVDPQAPIGAVYDALGQMIAFCINKMQEAQPKKEQDQNLPVTDEVKQE